MSSAPPPPKPVAIETGRGRFHALSWGEDPAAPLLLFAHATGMCAGIYADLLAPLSRDFRIIAFDARGHGRTEAAPAPEPLADWRLFRADLAALVRALGEGPVLLAGHSFGATVALETAAEAPGTASAVVMIEPAFVPFAHAAAWRAARAAGQPLPNPLADRAERRRSTFPSRAAMRESFRGRGVFADWPEAALEAYLAGAALEAPEGVRLACAPETEAAVFRGVSATLEASLAAARMPVILVHGTTGSTVQPEDAAAIAAMGHRVVRLDGAGHFVPVTAPGRVRPFLCGLAAGRTPAMPQARRAER